MKRFNEIMERGIIAFWIIVIIAMFISSTIMAPVVMIGTVAILASVFIVVLILGTIVKLITDWIARKRKEVAEWRN